MKQYFTQYTKHVFALDYLNYALICWSAIAEVIPSGMCQCNKIFVCIIFQDKECLKLGCIADKLFRCPGRTCGEQWDYNVWKMFWKKLSNTNNDIQYSNCPCLFSALASTEEFLQTQTCHYNSLLKLQIVMGFISQAESGVFVRLLTGVCNIH